ncbi:nucleosome assembly protein [Acrasis kona]|uniref:Nucleosome assembly protein n=1 Tax=Acrasis kona TaxID=1008807 RepID=A0AAW2ZFH5_9EUKA
MANQFAFDFAASSDAFQELTEEQIRQKADEDLFKSNTKKVVERVRVLQQIQLDQDELKSKMLAEIYQVQKRYHDKYQPLYTRRHEIVSGTKDITEAEKEKAKEVTSGGEPGQNADEAAAGVPDFWVTVLSNSEIHDEMIKEYDIEALKALVNITYESVEEEGKLAGFKLNFHFKENEYFTNTVLTKTFHHEEDDTPIKNVGTEIQWKEGKDLTVKVTVKTQRHKNNKQVRKIKKTVPQESFFQFFKSKDAETAPEPKDEEDEDEEDEDDGIQSLIEADQDVGEIFRDKIIPNALDYFLDVAEGDEDDWANALGFGGDDDEDDEDGDHDDDDGAQGPNTTAPQEPAPECKQQ